MSVTNLNKARKAKAKTTARKTADENAVKFGRTKGEKAKDKAEAKSVSAKLDGAQRDR